ncbi:uncharacterized protein LOC144642883 isoform X1 [Oculina patagonica]
MARFLPWTAVILAVYLVTFEGVLTREYNEHKSKANRARRQATDSTLSGNYNPGGRRSKTSKRSLPQVNGKPEQDLVTFEGVLTRANEHKSKANRARQQATDSTLSGNYNPGGRRAKTSKRSLPQVNGKPEQDLVTFEGVLTRANEHKSKANRARRQATDSTLSGNYNSGGRRSKTSKRSLPQVNGKPEQDAPITRNQKDVTPEPESNATRNESRRALPAAAVAVLNNPKVQEAAINKGVEVVGNLVDKQFENIEHAQNKSAEFLKKEIKLDIMPDKAWINDNMFVPSGYHIDASVEEGSNSPKANGNTPFTYPTGMGQVLMNGCWGANYSTHDPCYNSKAQSTNCWNMIDGAAFIGVGFDGNGKYSPESRKMSIVQRNCANKASYDGFDVPDTMNVHGIYDTSASMATFESRTQYQQHLQTEAGMSGSYFGFSAGVKAAWGGSMQASTQQYMAILDVDVDRYQIFMDEVKPSDLSLSFLREFMDLPVSYYHPGAQIKYQNFIQRWGTHYIKSAQFGGQLEIIKTMVASHVASKSEFAEKMEAEYRGLFASVGAKQSSEGGSQSREENKFTSTSVKAQGGSQEIATVLSDVYSPTFKGAFKEWLESIPAYPKAYRFLLGTITDLVNFRANDLFLGEPVDWGCEGHSSDLVQETTGDVTRSYYSVADANGTVSKFYCPFQDREELDIALSRRRASLKRAIETYMEEGPTSVSDMQIPECSAKDQSTDTQNDFLANTPVPTWNEITQQDKTITVTFDMENDLPRGPIGLMKIQRNMSREVRFKHGRWFTADTDGKFHMYSGYRNGKSAKLNRHKLSIFGLVLSYNSKYGSLELSEEDFNASKKIYPTLSKELVGFPLARVNLLYSDSTSPLKRTTQTPTVIPCNVKWSNALRLDPTTTGGRCLHFTASSAGDIFVVFATVPSRSTTWYYVQIGINKVAIYKGGNNVTNTSDSGAISIGDTLLYQSYFVCLYEKPNSTLIEYGKSLGTSESGDVYLTYLDTDHPLNVRFYAFGNMDASVKIWDAHILSRDLTNVDCKGITHKDLPTNLCVQKCHSLCDPFAGCRHPGADDLEPSDCLACRVARDPLTSTCLESCPIGTEPVTEDKNCSSTFDAKTLYGGTTAPKEFNYGQTFNGVELANIPQLNHLTLCLWTKFPPTSVTGYRNNTPAYYYEKTTRKGFQLDFLHQDGAESTNDPRGTFVIKNNGTERYIDFSKQFLDDHQWHHVCVTWNGVTGVTLVYVDGHRDPNARGRPPHSDGIIRGSITGGGKLIALRYASQIYYLTELNLWNIVRSAEEIAESSRSCFGSPGNVKAWHEFWTYGYEDKPHVSPSQCISLQTSNAPDSEVAENDGPPSENVDTTSGQDKPAGKKKYYLKYKKQASRKKTKKEKVNLEI